MSNPDPLSQETSKQVAKAFLEVSDDDASRQYAIRQLLVGAVACAVLIPAISYARFGIVR
jgi:hypothetical protein